MLGDGGDDDDDDYDDDRISQTCHLGPKTYLGPITLEAPHLL